MNVSLGLTPDVLVVQITEQKMFISTELGIYIGEKNLLISANLPKQLIEGVSQEDIDKKIRKMEVGISFTMVLSIILQVILKNK